MAETTINTEVLYEGLQEVKVGDQEHFAPIFAPVFAPEGGEPWANALKEVLGKPAYESFKAALKQSESFGSDCLKDPKGSFFTEIHNLVGKIYENEKDILELAPEELETIQKLTNALATSLGSEGTSYDDHLQFLEDSFQESEDTGAEQETPKTEQEVVATDNVAETSTNEATQEIAEQVVAGAEVQADGGAVVGIEAFQAFVEAMAARSKATITANSQVVEAMQNLNGAQQALLSALQTNSVALQIDEQMWQGIKNLAALPANAE